MSMSFEISTFKLAKISPKILDTKKIFFCRAVLSKVEDKVSTCTQYLGPTDTES